MRYRKLGETELEVSEVGFGLWTLAAPWWEPPGEADALALLRKAYDLGINYFDAAPAYGQGRGEQLLGKAFSGNREMVLLATKVGYEDAGARRWDADFVRTSLQASLERLQTDFVDLLWVHHPPLEALKDDGLFATLDALRDEGKVRFHGVCLGPATGHYEVGMHAIKKRFVSCVEHACNVLEQEPGRLLFTASLEGNTGNLIREIHASGPLEGAYEPTLAFEEAEAAKPRRPEFLRWAEAAARNLRWIHEGRDMTLAQAAIKFGLAEETVAGVLPNIRTEAQLQEFAEAPDKADFTQQELAAIAEQFRRAFDAPKG